MLGFDKQVWVTSVILDDDVQKALVLCYSLRRCYTNRKIAVVASPNIAPHLMKALYSSFDFVFYPEEALNVTKLKSDDFSKLYSLVALRSFEKCAYLSLSTMMVKNCDDIFSIQAKNITLLEEDDELSIFLFKPSVDIFNGLIHGLMDSNNQSGSGFGAYLKTWLKNEFKNVEFLPVKYGNPFKLGQALIGFEQGLSIHLVDCSTGSIKDEEYGGNVLLRKLVAIYLENILEENVLPLLKRCANVGPIFLSPSSSSAELRYNKEPIAIVGMSCRYPGSNNLEEFWDLLFHGKDATRNHPKFRWMREQCSVNKADARKTNAGFLKVPVDEFDAKFFGISPKEVLFMDPQHRLLHEVIWESLEDACIDPHSLHGTSGSVFLGSWTDNYNDIVMNSTIAEFYRAYMGNSIGAAAARISFLLGMTGPSISTESGCSSAMVALHLACRSLRSGETNLALVGGVNLLLHQFNQDLMPMMISPDGRSKTFSDDANGFARAEGCGVLVLKRLSDARNDGDNIWALIKGTGVTQEGISKSLGTPTIECESLAMEKALKDGDIRPEEVSYVEAHGTGTVVGDPLEIAAIAKAYKSPLRKERLVIGSVKTNVGHTESCSGITGIMKVVLAMFHDTIPPHRNFVRLNPAINLEAVPAVIPLQCLEWKGEQGKPRIAGVSSFGITGTDTHVIVEEPPQNISSKTLKPLTVNCLGMERPVHIIKISAKSEHALEIILENFQAWVKTTDEQLVDIVYSMNCGRANFAKRVALITRSKQDLVASIKDQKYFKGEESSIRESNLPKICFLFTGQGSQYSQMAKKLYESSPVFRIHFDYCNDILRNKYNINLKKILWSSTGNDKDNLEKISRTIYSQTSIFCVEYALVKLWESWGIKPDFVLGHSLGEFCAGVCANIISVQDALMLVAERSEMIDKLKKGSMLVIQEDFTKVQEYMQKFARNDPERLLDYAAINSSEQTVVSGDSDLIKEFSKYLRELKVKSVVLAATHAFHSKHMDIMLDGYRVVAKKVLRGKMKKQTCQFISGMMGNLVKGKDVDVEYWVKHTREKVNFLDASKKGIEFDCEIFIEIGPQPVLSALTMMNTDLRQKDILCLPSLKRGSDDWETILGTLGKLYVKGLPVYWQGLDLFYSRRKVHSLPHYPFIGKKYWPDVIQVGGHQIHPLLGSIIPNALSTKLFQCGVNLRSHEYIKDHAIGQNIIFPGAGYLEMSLAAGFATVEASTKCLGKPGRPMKVESLTIKAPLALQETSTVQLQTVVELNASTMENNLNDWNNLKIKIFQRQEESWLEHASAIFSPIICAEDLKGMGFDKECFFETLEKPVDTNTMVELYQKLNSVGLKFGPVFQSIENIWRNEDRGVLIAKVKLPLEKDNEGHIIHPVILDAMIQAIMIKKMEGQAKVNLIVPIKVGNFLWLSNGTKEFKDRYILVFEDKIMNVIAVLLDSNATVMARMSGLELIDTSVKKVEAVLEQQTVKLPDFWEEIWRSKLGPSQYRYELSLESSNEKKIEKEIIESFNKMDPNLEKSVLNLEKLVFLNYIRCLYECGWKPVLNEKFNQIELEKELKIQKKYSQLFTHILLVLEEEGILKRQRDFEWQVVRLEPTLSQVQNQLSLTPLNKEVVQSFKSTCLLQTVGEKYSKILQGELEALSLFSSDDCRPLLTDYYKLLNVSNLATSVITQHLKRLKSDCPSSSKEKKVLRVLEIGAEKLLESDYSQPIQYKKLNIEEDPISQGFTPNYYDWIVASDAIQMQTRDLNQTLVHVRTLLRNGGTFDLIEQTKVIRFMTYFFGLQDEFWKFDDFRFRSNNCTLSNRSWVETLGKCGFKVGGNFSCSDNRYSYISTKKSSTLLESEVSDEKLWILFHFDKSPVSNYLMKTIPTVINRKIIVVRRGEKLTQVKSNNEWNFELRQEMEQDFKYLVESLEDNGPLKIEGIVWCWSLDKSCTSQETVLKPYFSMIKSFLGIKQREIPKLTVFVNGVVAMGDKGDDDLSDFHKSTIWGFNKSLRNERIEMTCRSVDIGGQREDEEGVGEQAFFELWNGDKEIQVVYRQHARLTVKMQKVNLSLSDLKLPGGGCGGGSNRFQLILPETKAIADLQFGSLNQTILDENEVEIEVKASALNFKDVFNVLKPSDEFRNSNAVGFDYAGVVKRVGSKVSRWSVGDCVFGVNSNNTALPSYIKSEDNYLCGMPPEMSFAEASTLPAVGATCYHCLIDVAKITYKDTILIHTASGGVGLCAIQICKSIGAKVIATAGSNRKQNYLRSLGIQHVFHSRNTRYLEEIRRVTNGRGVNVVLNSLTGEGFKEATLEACALGARFVEMSKLSIWTKEQVKELRPDVQYTIVDLSQMNSKEWYRLMCQVTKMVETKIVKPIPYVRFDSVHIRQALEYLQKAKHIGKVVCIMPVVRLRNGVVQVVTPIFNGNVTYLITGGLGGIGFVVCRWMVDKGAKFVILVGRGIPSKEMKQDIDKLNEEFGANVKFVRVDVSDFKQCSKLIKNKIGEMGLPGLRGVMHAAGMLRDGLIENQSWESLSSTFGCKVDGTLNLHELTKDINLEFFVLFSSIASLFGSPGQCNHSAGNNFEDSFAHYRYSLGLPATTVNWGPWGEVGVAKEVDLPGIKSLSNLYGISALEYLLKSHRVQTGIVNIESFPILAKLFPYVSTIIDENVWKRESSFLETNVNANLSSDEFWQKYDSLLTVESKLEYSQTILSFILRNILKLDKTDVIENHGNLQQMGVDSLMFVEMKNAVQNLLGDRVCINASALRDCNTVAQLKRALVKCIEGDVEVDEGILSAEEVALLIRKDSELPDNIRSKPSQKRVEVKNISTVLLTGCTGTLGVYILRELTNMKQVDQVICLMRPTNQISIEDRLRNILQKREILSEIDMGKVKCLAGDVAKYHFGMKTDLWIELTDLVDAVFHCAAKVNHLEHYRKREIGRCDVRESNIGGLKNVLEFACSGEKLKHVNCASSMLSVNKMGNDGSVSENWPEPNDFSGVTTLAYPNSKFVEDLIMKEAILERGIPGKAFRFPFIMGDSKSGKFTLENNHLMLRYFFILKNGVMPSNPAPFPFLSVDICAWAMVKISFYPDAPCDVFNVCNKCPDLDQDFVFVAKELGFNVELVDFLDFSEKVRASAAKSSSLAVFEEFYAKDDVVMSLYSKYEICRWAIDGALDKSFMVSKKIAKILPEFYSESKCEGNEVYRDMLYAQSQGWFEKFGISKKTL